VDSVGDEREGIMCKAAMKAGLRRDGDELQATWVCWVAIDRFLVGEMKNENENERVGGRGMGDKSAHRQGREGGQKESVEDDDEEGAASRQGL
jgi:hypothetical protein